jgi:hypothetical protein
MAFISRRFPLIVVCLLSMALLPMACSDDGTGPGGELAPLVGTWRAETLTLTNQANPEQIVRLIQEGATFTLSILSNKQYQAVLQIFGQSNPEFGTIKVTGTRVTLTPVTPPGPATTGTWRFQGELLILDGDTEFDFNQDGTNEQAVVHFELRRIEL